MVDYLRISQHRLTYGGVMAPSVYGYADLLVDLRCKVEIPTSSL